jgi:hypothetical protein
MDCFTYNNINYELNSTILLKCKSRILKYKIIKINLVQNDYYNIRCQSILYEDIIHDIKFNIGTTNKFIKKYLMYDEPPNILCKPMKKKELVYSFHCDFCNKIHKHNYLGHQDCRCNCVYSPYSNSGYNLILKNKIIDFNTYLLYNLELFLKKNNYKGWSSYKLSVKKFYTGEVCEDYGKTHFPYINENMLNHIKSKYHNDNIRCSNGCLIAGLKYLIKMILNKTLIYEDKLFKNQLNDLYKFYKKNTLSKNKKIELLKNIIKSNEIEETEIEEKEIEENEIEENQIKEKEIEENEIEEKEIKEKEIEENEIDDNINIELDLICGLDVIENLSDTHINNIKKIITDDYPIYKNIYFYYPEDIKIYSKYLDLHDDIYFCISKLETNDNYTLFCVDEADCYDPEFIHFRLERNKNL